VEVVGVGAAGGADTGGDVAPISPFNAQFVNIVTVEDTVGLSVNLNTIVFSVGITELAVIVTWPYRVDDSTIFPVRGEPLISPLLTPSIV
jgi:hypothetical protein